jgi:hypothetical protein
MKKNFLKNSKKKKKKIFLPIEINGIMVLLKNQELQFFWWQQF